MSVSITLKRDGNIDFKICKLRHGVNEKNSPNVRKLVFDKINFLKWFMSNTFIITIIIIIILRTFEIDYTN